MDPETKPQVQLAGPSDRNQVARRAAVWSLVLIDNTASIADETFVSAGT